MMPEQFIAKWKLSTLGERQAAQPHFLDLCDLLGESKHEDPDNYCMERRASKALGRRGWSDVWKRISIKCAVASRNFVDGLDQVKVPIVDLIQLAATQSSTN